MDVAKIVRRLQAVEERHPDTAEELEPVIRALTDPDNAFVGSEQARKLLGVRSVNTVKRWIELGILQGTWNESSGRWQIPLDEILRLRSWREAVAGAGGHDLTDEDMDMLSASRRRSVPWMRSTRD